MESIGNRIRVVGIDPGTTTLGFSVIDLDLVTLKFHCQEALTLRGDFLTRGFSHRGIQGAESRIRIQGLRSRLVEMFRHFRPDIVACEDNFSGPNVQTHKTLIESVEAVRYALMETMPFSDFTLFTPTEAKKIVGAAGPGKGKQEVRDGVSIHPDLIWDEGALEYCDEHSVDAVLLAVTLCERLKAGFKQQEWPMIKENLKRIS